MKPHTYVEEGRKRRRTPSGGGAPSPLPVKTSANGRKRIHDANFAFLNLQTSDPSKNRRRVSSPTSSAKSSSWTFFSNHTHVLLCLHRDPDVLLREVAIEVGITERAVQKIVAELEEAKVVTRKRVGRRNHYAIRKRVKLRHPIESHRSVSDLLEFVK